ncbi:MAG: lipopolysaccharide export system permease protein [Gammaproteobacteria bacterium]|jgi:lipopolysaccharide export system permease protein
MSKMAGTTIIDRYIGSTIVFGVLMSLAGFLALSVFISFISELDNTDENYVVWDAIRYVIYGVPELATEMVPVAMLIGTIMGLGNLAANSELIVLRASGMSMWRMGFAVALTGAAIGFGHYLIADFVAPLGSQQARLIKAEARGGDVGTRLAGSLWFRDGSKVIQFRDLDSAQSIGRVEIFGLNSYATLDMAGQAERVTHEGQLWMLSDWKATHFADDEAEIIANPSKVWDTEVTPEFLSLLVVNPDEFSAFGLYKYIRYLRRNDLQSDEYQLALWKKILAPLSVIFMGLLALPFVFGPMRSSAVGQRLAIGIMLGLTYYMFNKIVADAGYVFGLQPFWAAILPFSILVLVSVFAVSRSQ